MRDNSLIKSENVFTTSHCVVEQCDETNSFFVTLFGEKVEMGICALLAFKTRIFNINIEQLLLENPRLDLEIIPLNCQNRLFVFNADELVELRDLLSGTFTMLEMNSIIHTSLRKRFF